MEQGLWVALAIVAVVIVYTVAKILQHARRSREQWQEVDRSKLREWQDDDDW